VTVVVGFVLAAALGALVRTEAGRRWNRHNGFPAGTLAVNVTGSFLLGTLATTAPPALTVLGVAGLGAYSTFSSFARDTVALAEYHRLPLAFIYVAASTGLGIGAAAIGVALTNP
jgi:CrcB protein